MMNMENEKDRTDRQRDTHTEQPPARNNPRLVFADPDVFFRDLLMEQEEQK